MKKRKLLPMLAARGVTQNGSVYYPYIVSCIFSVFTFFVFSSILENDLIGTLPHSAYAWIMLAIGRGLLGIILLPFLYYANSFLIKRRKKEMGLYSLLGLEKKHMGVILFLESLISYIVSVCGGILLGTVLSKFLFLLLLRLSGLPIEVEFVFVWKAVRETLVFFAAVFSFNFIYNLFSLQKAHPVELLAAGRKGEKEPRFLGMWTFLGVLSLAGGYTTAIQAGSDSMIFIKFFMAVFLVIAGTYFLFTAGSVALLKMLRRNRDFYYRPSNFITVSGMYYRMKKSAAGLSNICIFSAMVIITLTCTVCLYAGNDGITHYDYPYDVSAEYDAEGISAAEVEAEATKLSDAYGQTVRRMDSYECISLACGREEDRFAAEFSPDRGRDNYTVRLMTLEDYNRIAGTEETLEDGQVLIYSTGPDYGYPSVNFMGITAKVKAEVKELYPYPKEKKNRLRSEYVLIVKDQQTRSNYIRAWAEVTGFEDPETMAGSIKRRTEIVLEGEDAKKKEFAAAFTRWCKAQNGFFMSCKDGLEGREILCSMNGGLLFIGIVFGLLFFMCLLLIMYYKQISEGYEDQGSFEIMRKVGMSEGEIQGTVRKQILMVFAMPLVGSLLHSAVGLVMVNTMMVTLHMFNTRLLIISGAGVAVFFILVYGISYLTTSGAYYRIVKGK